MIKEFFIVSSFFEPEFVVIVPDRIFFYVELMVFCPFRYAMVFIQELVKVTIDFAKL